MSRNLLSSSLLALGLACPAMAEVPRVSADIAPVHSLVARVMAGVGEPSLIVSPGASPHEYNLRPSQAAALQNADLVFWVSPDLTPWLEGAISSLAADAAVTELLEAEGTIELEVREGALFESHDHDEDREAEDGHADDLEEDHSHEGHAHDPHAWLSTDNASVWLNTIATELSAADPDNASTYKANAAEAQEELSTLRTEINEVLEPKRGGKFISFHDAYQYFEHAFEFPASGAISLSDASAPSPGRIAEIRARVAEQGIGCVLSEPQFDPGIVNAVMEGSAARTAVVDPLGAEIEPGPELYPQVLRNLAAKLADCM
ncbi:zinc ABC transporter substrate-binding protein [Algicella marina]|uniref:High-affinity zinc uptake system protein ZnuA n=1 Tax=Algicella marina TaxID=2683284 RepID=A0A6P1T0Q6_9RHOB|nr:zinc ABC transporter substrate-binding protein [Algicella marina]QHQ35355.1 zinc transporter [Algicella marina]